MRKNKKNLTILAVAIILFLVFYNLPNFPLTWFDEGSHLHVPKTIVKFGEYADISSEGFRYYGPTIGVGPTVMLPIAGVFSIFGSGLVQARIVIAIYLVLTLLGFYKLAYGFGSRKYAVLVVALLMTSRSILILELGRQVLGEIPGLFFIVTAFLIWFSNWSNANVKRLILTGVLLGLAVVTKYQYLLFLAPALGLAWIANLVYYRSAPQRNFIIPGAVAGFVFGLWQVYMLAYLGPATIGENFALLRNSAMSAAFNFSPQLIDANLTALFSRSVFLGALLPGLVYGFFLILPRQENGQKWGIIYFLVLVNLGWFVVFSIGWVRYAFIGITFSTMFISKFIIDLTYGFQVHVISIFKRSFQKDNLTRDLILPATVAIWAAAIIIIPITKTVKEIISPPVNYPALVSEYLDDNIPKDAVIETWEPELGFLTDHTYHFPPTELLTKAIDHVYFDGPVVAEYYDYYLFNPPDYFVVGEFSAWVGVYDWAFLEKNYELVDQIGAYQIYRKVY